LAGSREEGCKMHGFAFGFWFAIGVALGVSMLATSWMICQGIIDYLSRLWKGERP
jgi:ABC-type nickel/cobalt efflux system permease component RcnA